MKIIAQSPELTPSDYETSQTLDDVFKAQQNALLSLQQNTALKLSFITQKTGGDIFLGVHGLPSLKVEAYFYRAGNEYSSPLVYSVNLTD